MKNIIYSNISVNNISIVDNDEVESIEINDCKTCTIFINNCCNLKQINIFNSRYNSYPSPKLINIGENLDKLKDLFVLSCENLVIKGESYENINSVNFLNVDNIKMNVDCFYKASKLQIISCKFENKLEFNKEFPNLEVLSITDCYLKFLSLPYNIPNLKELCLDGNGMNFLLIKYPINKINHIDLRYNDLFRPVIKLPEKLDELFLYIDLSTEYPQSLKVLLENVSKLYIFDSKNNIIDKDVIRYYTVY